jgi:hypothetical protein
MPTKLTTEIFILRSREKYRNLFDYSLCDYTGGNKLITLKCSQNHIFTTYPATHLSKISRGGCKECYKLNIFDNRRHKITHDEFIARAKEAHNNIYDYSKTIFTSLHNPIIIICKIHGEFTQSPISHLYTKRGCNACGRIKTETALALTEEQIKNKIIKFNIIHKNKYTYGNTFRENKILWLEIICPTHGKHVTRLFNHEKGHGCPKCVSVRSNVQIKWLEYRAIRDGYIQHADNKGEFIIPNTKLCVDGYNKKTNTIYEFHGDFWHGNPKVYDLDKINRKLGVSFRELYDKTIMKMNTIHNMGYNVVYIWEYDWTKAIKYVKLLQRKWRKSRRL